MNLRASPCMRLFVPFALGLMLGAWLDYPVPHLGKAVVLMACVVCLLALQKFSYRYRWVFGACCSLALFLAGYFYVVNHNELRRPLHFSEKIKEERYLIGTIYDTPGKGSKMKVPIRVEAIGPSPDSMGPASGNLLLFLDFSPEVEGLRYGDRLGIYANVFSTESAKNPHAFDYGRYLHFQNIHFQAFVKSGSLVRLSSGNGNIVWQAAFHCRDRLLSLLHRHFPTQNEYAVASALLVGYKEDLSDELRAAYSATGSMHALAISGTHVGMLYAGLFFLLKRLRLRGRKGRMVETLFLVSAIWGFAFLTGATASVLRATVMFSTYLLGKAFFRRASVWNVLPASAFALLLYNPYFLFHAGFQLSYSAVAGIVFFYPRFYKLMPLLPKWGDGAVQILLLGVAAQLGTLPLSLYYFHQFPVYFWLAGWAVVFGGALYMAGGAALVLMDGLWPWLAEWLGKGLYWLLWGLNQLIFGIQGLPGSVLGGIWLASWAAFAIGLLVVVLGAFLEYKRAKWLIGALSVLLFLGVCRMVRETQQMRQAQLAIYYVNKNRLMDFFDGQSVVSLSDSATAKQVLFAAHSNRLALGTRDLTEFNFASDTAFAYFNFLFDPPFAQFFEKRMAMIDDARWVKKGNPRPLPVDVLMLSQSPRVSIAECQERFPFQMVVFDASNSWKQAGRWKEECERLGVPFHDVREQGAWVWHRSD